LHLFPKFSVLLGRLGRQRSFLTVSLPGSPRVLRHPCRGDNSDVRHLSSEGSGDLSCSGFSLLFSCGKHMSTYLLYVYNVYACGRVF